MRTVYCEYCGCQFHIKEDDPRNEILCNYCVNSIFGNEIEDQDGV